MDKMKQDELQDEILLLKAKNRLVESKRVKTIVDRPFHNSRCTCMFIATVCYNTSRIHCLVSIHLFKHVLCTSRLRELLSAVAD